MNRQERREAAREQARRRQRGEPLTVIEGVPLHEGWTLEALELEGGDVGIALAVGPPGRPPVVMLGLCPHQARDLAAKMDALGESALLDGRCSHGRDES
jgi:hypothetical protein